MGESALLIEKLRAGHWTIYTDIIIDAPPHQVWAVLCDFEAMADWSPALQYIKGDLKNGATVTTGIRTNPEKPNSRIFSMKHKLKYKEKVFYGWSGVFLAGIKDYHLYKVEAMENGRTRFIQSDEFKGGLTWLLGYYLANLVRKAYPLFNKALKKEVERRYG